MTAAVILLGLGGVLLLAGLAGHGVKTNWIELPPFSAPLRWVSFVIGGVLLGFGIYVALPGRPAPIVTPTTTPPGPVAPGDPPPEAPRPTVAVEGRVLDVFGNPRADVIVMTPRRYDVTDGSGRYLIDDIRLPVSPAGTTKLTVRARHGDEVAKASIRLAAEDSGKVKPAPDLLLDPTTSSIVKLCRTVDDGATRTCRDEFEDWVSFAELAKPEVCALAKVHGPEGYPRVKLTAEWYQGGEMKGTPLTREYTLSPTPLRGFLTCRQVWPGDWSLRIRTTDTELPDSRHVLAEMPFEVGG